MAKISRLLPDGHLVAYEDWCKHIDSLRSKKCVTDEEEASQLIREPLISAVRARIPGKPFGILFSGGIDSTLIAYICKRFTDDFICYTVGIEGSKDIEASTQAAKTLGLKHRKKILTIKEAETAFEKTARILGSDLVNIVNIGVGSVIVAAIELAREDGINCFFSGLGSEEIFAGYQRHEKSTDINEECWLGLKGMWKRDFLRDYRIAQAMSAEFYTPFLDTDLIIKAMQIDGRLKIKCGDKKYILRKMATDAGLKEEFAFRPKSAAQYGSSFDKAIARIAKSKGFRYKKEYLNLLSCLS